MPTVTVELIDADGNITTQELQDWQVEILQQHNVQFTEKEDRPVEIPQDIQSILLSIEQGEYEVPQYFIDVEVVNIKNGNITAERFRRQWNQGLTSGAIKSTIGTQIHTFNYSTQYGTFTTQATTEQEAQEQKEQFIQEQQAIEEQEAQELQHHTPPITDPTVRCYDITTLDENGQMITERKNLTPIQANQNTQNGLYQTDCDMPLPTLEQVRTHYNWQPPITPPTTPPEEEENMKINPCSVLIKGQSFEIEQGEIRGTVILEKVQGSWNPYYNGAPLTLVVQYSDINLDVALETPSTFSVTFPQGFGVETIQKIPIHRSVQFDMASYKRVRIKIFLWTSLENPVSFADGIGFDLDADENPIDILPPKPCKKSDNFLGTATGIFAGLTGLSLLLMGSKKFT